MHEILAYIALSMGVAWASGINLYAAILVLGLLGSSGNMPLPEALQPLQNPLVIGVAGLMYFIEFFADKIPGSRQRLGHIAHIHPYSCRCSAGHGCRW